MNLLPVKIALWVIAFGAFLFLLKIFIDRVTGP
jgi:hypothetical protein